MTATKTTFLSEMRKALEAKAYPWLKEPSYRFENMSGLDGMMKLVEQTITTDKAPVDMLGSPTAKEAWKAIGMKGKLSYKALRALPA